MIVYVNGEAQAPGPEHLDVVARPLAFRCAVLRFAADDKRDALIEGGFAFAGHRFQSRASDRENIAGMAQAAALAVAAGEGEPGDLRWADPDQDFVWIAADNQLVPMDAPTVIALFRAGVVFKSALTFHGRSIKDAAEAALAAEDAAAMTAAEAELAADWPVP